jgi:PAS domain S-box-containing protein
MDFLRAGMAVHPSERSAVGATPALSPSIAALIDSIDWETTPVGPRSDWPQSLQTALDITLDSAFPMVVTWGPELVLFYNASYAAILGRKHPWAMGRPVREVWPEIWDTIGPMLHGVMRTGVATYYEDLLLPLFRNGYLEECYFTFSYSPIAARDGVGGVFCAVAETSRKVIADRRLRTLHELDAREFGAKDLEQACRFAAGVLGRDARDLPFSRIYLFGNDDHLRLIANSGPAAASCECWPVEEVARRDTPLIVPSMVEMSASLGGTASVKSAIVLPIKTAGDTRAVGAVVLGLSPFCAVDDEYSRFLELIAEQIGAAVDSARAHQAAKTSERALTVAERTRDAAMENERILRMLADAIPQIVCTAGPDGRVDYFNRRWFEFTGFTEEQTFRKSGWRAAIHPDDRPLLEPQLRFAVERGDDFSLEVRVRSASGEYRWFLVRAVAVRDKRGGAIRFFSTATDIDEQKRVEERESFLSHVSEELGSTLEVRTILQKITELCVPTFADWCQVQTISPEDDLIVEAVNHCDQRLKEQLETLVGRMVVAPRNRWLGSPDVVREGRSRVLDHDLTVRAVRDNVADPEDRAVYEAAGLGTALIVPLVARGQVRGTLHLVDVNPTSRRPRMALEIAEELARRAAVAMDNSRLYEREHRVASALQRAMLPERLPSHDRLELSSAYRPAERESRVGGDWYDAFLVSENCLAVSIGDVGGHGLEAAVAMNEARHALRLSALEGMTPAQTLLRANAALMFNEDHPIITAVFGIVDVEHSTFRYSCAGHPHPAIVPLAGRARFIDGGGIPLGVDVASPFPTLEVSVEAFETILLYTDGLIEFDRNIERESLRLLDALTARVQDRTVDGAGALVRSLLRDHRQFDDIAVLAATILPAHPGPVELRLPAAPPSAAVARRLALRYARVAKLTPERTFDLTIAVGEAVANAVEHAYRGADGDFVLRLSTLGDEVTGEVQDLGVWRGGNPDAERGRGLAILRATTSRLELDRTPHGTTVAFAV